jgi:hypothetical protein
MREVLLRQREKSPAIGGHLSTPPDRNVQSPISFKDLARMAWPDKTEAHLAHLTRVDARTCRRWLAGNNEPPAEALGIVLAQIMSRYSSRV